MSRHLRPQLILAAMLVATLACDFSLGGSSAPTATPAPSASPSAVASGTPAPAAATALSPGTAAPQPATSSVVAPTSAPTSAPALAPSPTAAAATPSPASASTSAPPLGGRITYTLGAKVYRLAASAGAAPQDVSAALDALSPGNDSWLNTSPDGAWLVLGTGRFDPTCAAWTCLAVVAGDLSSGSAVSANGQLVHPDAFSAIAPSGNLIVYSDPGGPHAQDLWAVSRAAGNWSAPVLLTNGSPYAYNAQPAISLGGGKVLFDCGDQPYAAKGTAICEVGVAGGGFRVVLTPAGAPPGYPATGALHHPDYAPDGSIVFEANWGVEQIWRLAAGAALPQLVTSQYTNDNSPCVLPDNRIVSLWLGRPGNPSGLHELKIMSSDGANPIMPLNGQDVADIGLGCGQ